ncbi:phosphomannomutase [Saccharophagus sp. K07]|uniref:phosphomannomutase n=1 Tax=Saccharophagus sp. K07 TaxID=2283636 RepID=UPI0016527B4B|nr:phosphomannomutase [Saccharophagus sp. K07]MBC6905705.1 phosphomannomutase [Saccharophagus sp. K07]
MKIECFKAYDIRGRVPEELNEEVAYRVGRAFVDFLDAKSVVVGHDIRLTSASLTDALVRGLTEAGADVTHIGQCGTEEVYFATFHLGVDGGICVTASHNPMDYNGMKLVQKGSRPISNDSGLSEIRALAESGIFKAAKRVGSVTRQDMRAAYVDHLLSYVDVSKIKPLKVVANPGNGGAGAVVNALESYLPLEFVKVHFEPDGNFPNGIPNPILVENQGVTSRAVIEAKADIGIAWDGDFDRCFFFDEKGNFIDGYYVVGLLAESFLAKYPGASIVHDPRLVWNTVDLVESNGGKAVQSKTGHAFIKERMRLEDAVYGGEMSAHHYFRDFAYCDNGTIPWLLLVELMSRRGQTLSEMVSERIAKFPCSGEINRKVADPVALLKRIEEIYSPEALQVDKTDGLSIAFADWRFNVRSSSTEPVFRLNVEARGDVDLMKRKTEELLALM